MSHDPQKVVYTANLEKIMALHDAAARALALYTIAVKVGADSTPDLERKAGEARAKLAEAVIWALPSVQAETPAAWLYESAGMVHDDKHPPIVTVKRWSTVDEPWSETPLHRPMKAAEL